MLLQSNLHWSLQRPNQFKPWAQTWMVSLPCCLSRLSSACTNMATPQHIHSKLVHLSGSIMSIRGRSSIILGPWSFLAQQPVPSTISLIRRPPPPLHLSGLQRTRVEWSSGGGKRASLIPLIAENEPQMFHLSPGESQSDLFHLICYSFKGVNLIIL